MKVLMMISLKLPKLYSLLFIMLMGITVNAAAEQVFTVAKPIVFKQGSAKFKALLSKIEDAKDVMDGRYLVGTADLNDDGRMEIILQSSDSMYCGSGGCLTVVIEQPKASSTQTYTLLSQNLGSSLAVTNEKVGNYRALASLMEDGKIQIADKKDTPLYGKQMVYAMNNASPTASETKPEIATPATTPQKSTAATTLNKAAPSIAGISLGMTAAEAKSLMQTHVRTYDKSLQVKEDGEVGIGSDGKTATGAKPYIYLYSAGFSGESSTVALSSAPKNIMNDYLYVSVSPPPNSRVISINRKIRFAYQQDVPSESLYEQLRSKYGPEKGKAYQNLLWFFDNTGKPTSPPAVASIKGRGNCAPELATPNVNYRDTYKKGEVRGYFNPACGVVLMIRTETNATSGLTPTVETTLSDSNAISDAIVDSRTYLSGQSSAAESQLKSQSNKRAVPNL